MSVCKIAITGISGRLGRAIAHEVIHSPHVELTGGMVSSDSFHLGADIGEMAGAGFVDIAATVSLEEACASADVVIDATAPQVTTAIAGRLAEAGGPALVTGVTGLDEAQTRAVEAAADRIALLTASNFSLGVAVLEGLVARAAKALPGDRFDLEISETHHSQKRDAPSGTAISLGRAAAQARGVDFDQSAQFQRERTGGVRPLGEIGFSSQRGGGIIGEHDVRFLGTLEDITLSHRAHDRRIFAQGALVAAQWIKTRSAGHYTMQDVVA